MGDTDVVRGITILHGRCRRCVENTDVFPDLVMAFGVTRVELSVLASADDEQHDQQTPASTDDEQHGQETPASADGEQHGQVTPASADGEQHGLKDQLEHRVLFCLAAGLSGQSSG